MEKRLFFAITLSFIFLFVWANIVGKQQAVKSLKKSESYQNIKIEETPSKPINLPQKEKVNLPPSFFELTLKNRKIIFLEPQSCIKQITFSDYQDSIYTLQNALLFGFGDMPFSKQLIDNKEVKYEYVDKEKRIIKDFIFNEEDYGLQLKIIIENLTGNLLNIELPLSLGTADVTANDRMHFIGATVWDEEKLFYPNLKNSKTFHNVKFVSLRNRYFCIILEPQKKGYSAYINKLGNNSTEISVSIPEKIGPYEKIIQNYKIFIGPQDKRILAKVDPNWTAVIYFGKLDFIAQGLLKILEIFYLFFKNWGWAIVALSIFIYLVLYPLTLKQMKSMKEMQILQPQVEKLRQQYKNNPQRLNQEILELYKAHKINPMGGCLPILLQIPVFFALYQVLSRSISLKGASFLWIKDLSESDRILMLPNSLPLIGNEINILPLLMAIIMVFQQKLTTQTLSGPQAEQQKLMTIILPIMFGVLFYHMPAGLVLYWLVNSLLTLTFQIRLAKTK
ncbi:MAG: membrane protein insertase YidC [Candidatus Omnitrophica bacterium]|nr:membrane protein insertase YidC [Candidatus Omnitrophota bacterium]